MNKRAARETSIRLFDKRNNFARPMRPAKSPKGGRGGAGFWFEPRAQPKEWNVECNLVVKEKRTLPFREGVYRGEGGGGFEVKNTISVAGAGINIAQRVMDCGDAGHILLSRHVAEDLAQYRRWKPHLHDLGDCEVKHGVRVFLVNLYTEELGNPAMPEKFKKFTEQTQAAAVPATVAGAKAKRIPWGAIAAGLLLIAALLAGVLIFSHRSVPQQTNAPATSAPSAPSNLRHPREEHRRASIRQLERRQAERLFHRRRAGRNPDRPGEDRGPESDQPHFGHAV